MVRNVSATRYFHRIGEVIGMLTFTGILEKTGDRGRALGTFKCKCGNERVYAISRVLVNMKRTDCGCSVDKGSWSKTHGMRGSPEYRSWQGMKNRCLNVNDKDYRRWGGRGISIHQEWIDSFELFYSHIGPKPLGKYSIERIDNNKGYIPGNVEWANCKCQAENRSNSWIVEIDGIIYASLHDASNKLGVSETTVVRWCDGFTDSRRSTRANNGYTPPKPRCKRWKKYAN